MRIMFLCSALCLGAAVNAQSPLAATTSFNDLAADIQYIALGNSQHICAPNWFVIEQGRWKCIRRNAQDRLDVVSFGPLPAVLADMSLIRRPIADDRRLLFASATSSKQAVYAFDPVTLEAPSIGVLPPQSFFRASDDLVDFDGDDFDELMLLPSAGGPSRYISLPGAAAPEFQVVGEFPLIQGFAGQFDADSRDEIGIIDSSSRIQLYDAMTGLQEPISISGFHSTSYPLWTGDWDGDGIEELAAVGAFGGPLSLIDLNAAIPRIEFGASGQSWRPVELIDWLPGSRDLVLYSRDQFAVVDPATGIARASFTGNFATSAPQLPIELDWDGDGDQDLFWHHREQPSALWLLRNPQKPTAVQYGAGPKLAIGYLGIGNATRLLTIESFDADGSAPMRLRTRNPQSLALLSDVLFGSGDPTLSEFALADLHSQPGKELLYNSGYTLSLHSVDGALLWEREVSEPLRRFASVQIPDFTCSGNACKQVLILDYSIASGSNTARMRLLDSETGNETWSLPSLPMGQGGPLALTDLDGDGVPEVIYQGTGLTVLDGVTRTLRWQSSNIDNVRTVRRTEDSRRRLAALTVLGTLSYLDTATGAELRSLSLVGLYGSENFFDAEMRYLAHTDNAGLWIISHTGRSLQGAPQTWLVPRNLRGPGAQDSTCIARRFSVQPPTRIHIGEDTQTLHVVDIEQNALFEDEFETW